MTTLRGAAAALAAVVAACAPTGTISPSEVTFDTAVLWLLQGADSARLLVEIAEARPQHEVGLAGRADLPPDNGMLFLFSTPRSPDDGFWMWRTPIPLDLAFIDASGTIRQVVSMDPCTARTQDECPGYFPDAAYTAALEVNRGWFARRGLGAGASVRLER